MTVDYRNRDQLYRSAVEALGREEADTLMASLPPMDWSEMATKTDLALLKADLGALEERMGLRFEKVDAQFETLEHKLTATFESALRRQTQWLVGGLGAMAVSMLGVVISFLTLG